MTTVTDADEAKRVIGITASRQGIYIPRRVLLAAMRRGKKKPGGFSRPGKMKGCERRYLGAGGEGREGIVTRHPAHCIDAAAGN